MNDKLDTERDPTYGACCDYVLGRPITPEFDAQLRVDEALRKRLTEVHGYAMSICPGNVRREPVTVEPVA